ncbi:MAG: FAD-binding oxidoreductase [Elusimicrobia bacterium]|nr:FAD-binding oxidoreductase [Elusimicrobiota bacterium]
MNTANISSPGLYAETLAKGAIPADHVHPDSLKGIPRRQTNPARWNGEGWDAFVGALRAKNVEVREKKQTCLVYATDCGGLAYGRPHGVTLAGSAEQISAILKEAQKRRVPVTVKGGGLTTEGESVAFGGLQLDMRGMNRVISVDGKNMTVRAQAGIHWHTLAEALRRDGLDYLSAPLNLTASVGGTLGVGGIDINSPRLGPSADQAVSLQVVTPTGEIRECSESENPELFERVLLGYGQFGVITEAVLRVRKFTPITMYYFYYGSLRDALQDLQLLVREDAADYCGILTILDKAINLLVAFDSDEREHAFFEKWRNRIRGHGEPGFALRMAWHYGLRPWRLGEALYLLGRKRALEPAFKPGQYMENGKIVDRAVVFGNQVWKFWGGRQMVIPDLAVNAEKFVEAIERGNAVCRKYFPRYTLYCVGIKLSGRRQRYELSCVPPDAVDFAYGCEFEPLLGDAIYSREYLQTFKNEIYDIGVDMKTSYYRFGGMMKGYIRRAFGDELVDKHLAMKRAADPAMILNPDVIF